MCIEMAPSLRFASRSEERHSPLVTDPSMPWWRHGAKQDRSVSRENKTVTRKAEPYSLLSDAIGLFSHAERRLTNACR